MRLVPFTKAYQEDIPLIIKPEKAAEYIRNYLLGSSRHRFLNNDGLYFFLLDAGLSIDQVRYQHPFPMAQLAQKLNRGDFFLLDERPNGFDSILFFDEISPFLPAGFRARVKQLPSYPWSRNHHNSQSLPFPPSSLASNSVPATPATAKETRASEIQTNKLSATERAALLKDTPEYRKVLSAVNSITSKGEKLNTVSEKFLLEVTTALKNARGIPEALGCLGGNYTATYLGLEMDPRYIDRYHGPDAIYLCSRYNTDKKELEYYLVEAEFKGYNSDSTELSSNSKREKQGSEDKNLTRAEKMLDKQEQGKVDQASGRQGGPYTQDEMALWSEIARAKGKKKHLAVFTNTESGNVQAFWQNRDGDLIEKALDNPIPNFNDAKAIINEVFSRKK